MSKGKTTTPRQSVLRQTLVHLTHLHSRWRSEEATGGSADLDELVAGLCPAYGEDELDGVLEGSPRSFSTPSNRYIFLEPVLETGIMLPVLALMYNFQKQVPELRLRLTLFRLHNDNLETFGLRFETPEATDDHKYFHAQLIGPPSGFLSPEESQRWLPETQPCLVLHAEDEISLLACLLVSLYGLVRARQLLMDSNFGQLVAGHLKGMPWFDSDVRVKPKYETDGEGRWRRKKP